MKTSLMPVDGVLRKLVGGHLVPEGMRLYDSLASTGRVVLLHDGSDHDQVRDWLELNGCIKHDFIEWGRGPRVGAANHLRRLGYDIDLVVEPDPKAAHGLIAAGFNTIVFVHSQYSHPSWRPDTSTGIQSWDDINQQVADLARMKARDARLKAD